MNEKEKELEKIILQFPISELKKLKEKACTTDYVSYENDICGAPMKNRMKCDFYYQGKCYYRITQQIIKDAEKIREEIYK